jgi:hypothetical protein
LNGDRIGLFRAKDRRFGEFHLVVTDFSSHPESKFGSLS